MHSTHGKMYEAPSGTPIPPIPRPPNPSADTGIAVTNEPDSPDSRAVSGSETGDVFTLKPLAALKILCRLVEGLTRRTGDIPPASPTIRPSALGSAILSAGKEDVGRHSGGSDFQRESPGAEDDDGVPARAKTPIGSPVAHPMESLHGIGANKESLNIQHSAVVRKFYSKKAPPINVEEYLLRLHRYCPMSTAVYLATSLYIHRLAVIEKIMPITFRNVHRLVLAGLRVAMKALEDQSYPHQRFAKVGGVSGSELGRLEVSFCFITNFELKVDKGMLLEHAKAIRNGD